MLGLISLWIYLVLNGFKWTRFIWVWPLLIRGPDPIQPSPTRAQFGSNWASVQANSVDSEQHSESFSESTQQTQLRQNWANTVSFITVHNDSSKPVSGPFRVRFEIRLKCWTHSWVSETLEEFHSFWEQIWPLQAFAWRHYSVLVYFQAPLGYSLTSPHIFCDILHPYCEFVVIVSCNCYCWLPILLPVCIFTFRIHSLHIHLGNH